MELSLEALQAYLYEHYGKWGNETGLFMKLVEEMGETAEILNMRAGRKSEDGSDLQQELGKELADMIHYIVAIAALNDIDLSRILIEKDRVASIKYNHKYNFEEFLANREAT